MMDRHYTKADYIDRATELAMENSRLRQENARLQKENAHLDAYHREYLATWGVVTEAKTALLERLRVGLDALLGEGDELARLRKAVGAFCEDCIRANGEAHGCRGAEVACPLKPWRAE